jgi:hypothetical protein
MGMQGRVFVAMYCTRVRWLAPAGLCIAASGFEILMCRTSTSMPMVLLHTRCCLGWGLVKGMHGNNVHAWWQNSTGVLTLWPLGGGLTTFCPAATFRLPEAPAAAPEVHVLSACLLTTPSSATSGGASVCWDLPMNLQRPLLPNTRKLNDGSLGSSASARKALPSGLACQGRDHFLHNSMLCLFDAGNEVTARIAGIQMYNGFTAVA